MIPGFGFVIMLACAGFYYTMGEMGKSSGILWAAISLVLWLGASLLLGWGMLGGLLTQAGLFVGLTAWNIVKARSRK